MDIVTIAVITLVVLLVVGVVLALNRKGWHAKEATLKTPLGDMKFEPPAPTPALPHPTREEDSTTALRPAREFGETNISGGVGISGGTTSVRGDLLGGDKAETIIKDSTVYLQSSATATESSNPPVRQPHGFIPVSSVSQYIERGIEQDICEQLLSSNGVAVVVSVNAPGGVGKTELAKRIAAELMPHFEDAFWIDLKDHNPEQVINTFRLKLGLTFAPNANFAQRIVDLQTCLSQHRYLFIMDDMRDDNKGLLYDFIPPSPCATLITSRIRQLSHHIPANAIHRLDNMNDQQARALLKATLGSERVQSEEAAVRKLIERCRRNPLALDIAARRIRQLIEDGKAQPIAFFAQKVQQRLDELQAGDDERLNLYAVFGISYDDLTSSDQARFRRLAVFAPTGFSVLAAAHLWGDNLDVANHAVARLLDMSLLKIAEAPVERY